ncbi:uncharacterized protein BDR25DRAFT_350730 [Lindgomyces ingoldianus]|uniref:Uncharacterized protein n=1 Tax=Lindgomyces ingoldianus TaxID=673940 RepID=A0ACB6R7W2_9PLEO|nr:uncharacterized protein BDR25DRAFT_350730 [Lindgomyces ingoldianus]KAF2475344.1 hypothetical protein BDR25DRAFT_350730 [Lindgomyces ingoldianus]
MPKCSPCEIASTITTPTQVIRLSISSVSRNGDARSPILSVGLPSPPSNITILSSLTGHECIYEFLTDYSGLRSRPGFVKDCIDSLAEGVPGIPRQFLHLTTSRHNGSPDTGKEKVCGIRYQRVRRTVAMDPFLPGQRHEDKSVLPRQVLQCRTDFWEVSSAVLRHKASISGVTSSLEMAGSSTEDTILPSYSEAGPPATPPAPQLFTNISGAGSKTGRWSPKQLPAMVISDRTFTPQCSISCFRIVQLTLFPQFVGWNLHREFLGYSLAADTSLSRAAVADDQKSDDVLAVDICGFRVSVNVVEVLRISVSATSIIDRKATPEVCATSSKSNSGSIWTVPKWKHKYVAAAMPVPCLQCLLLPRALEAKHGYISRSWAAMPYSDSSAVLWMAPHLVAAHPDARESFHSGESAQKLPLNLAVGVDIWKRPKRPRGEYELTPSPEALKPNTRSTCPEYIAESIFKEFPQHETNFSPTWTQVGPSDAIPFNHLLVRVWDYDNFDPCTYIDSHVPFRSPTHPETRY